MAKATKKHLRNSAYIQREDKFQARRAIGASECQERKRIPRIMKKSTLPSRVSEKAKMSKPKEMQPHVKAEN